ncbi:MAG: hypothetical protein U9P61_02925 [Patescibacteria group bacterium]|nr:hypothetical protein [Patescibacteria group bacterium]
MNNKIEINFTLWIIYLIFGLFFVWFFLPAIFGLFAEDIPPIDDSDLALKKVIISDDENIYFDLMELEDLNYSRLISSDIDINSLLFEDSWNNDTVERVLNENEELLEKIDDMLEKSAYQNPNFADPENIEMNMEINFPSTYFWRDMVEIKALEALYLSKKGSHKEAIEEVLKLIEVGHKIQNSQLSSSEYLTTIGIKKVGLKILQKIISSSELSSLEISNYAKKLDAFYDDGYGLESALKIEYYGILRQIGIIAGGDKEAIKDYAESMGAGRRMIQKIKSDYFFQPNKTKSYFAGTSRADIATIEQLCGEAEGAEIVEFFIVDPNFGPYTENFIGKTTYQLSSVSLAEMNQARCEQNLFLSVTRAMMGIRAFKNDHGKYPDSLDELVPVYLPSIPIDPFDENPIRYSPEKKIIYSIGRSMEDLGGSSGDNWSKMKNPTFKISF